MFNSLNWRRKGRVEDARIALPESEAIVPTAVGCPRVVHQTASQDSAQRTPGAHEIRQVENTPVWVSIHSEKREGLSTSLKPTANT